jgi:hypothetical protein
LGARRVGEWRVPPRKIHGHPPLVGGVPSTSPETRTRDTEGNGKLSPRRGERPRASGEPPSISDLAREVRATVTRAAPGLRTVVKWSSPWLAGNDLVVVVGGFTRHVGVEFYRGTSLPDPAHLLEGTGKNLRHVKVRTRAEARAPALEALVAAAVRLDAREPPRKR